MIPEENFTGTFNTNLFSFNEFDLATTRVICEVEAIGGTPITVGKSHVVIYSTTMRALGFEQSGHLVTLENFKNRF